MTGTVMAPRSALSEDDLADGRAPLLQWLMPRAQAVSGHVAVPGATVQALSLPNFQEIGNPVTTETEGENKGKYTLTGIPQGTPIIIVATKETPKGVVRLATYVEKAANRSGVDMDAVTTLTTEVLAFKVNKSKSSYVSQADWESARNPVNDFLKGLSDEELARTVTVGAGYIGDRPGGTDGELGDDFPEELLDVIADAPDPDLTEAKIMVQALRDAGYTVMNTIETQLQSYIDSIGQEIAPFVNGVAVAYERISRPVAAILRGLDPGVYEELGPGDYRYITGLPAGSWQIEGIDGLLFNITRTSENPVRLSVVVTSDSPDVHADYQVDITADDPQYPSSFTVVGHLENAIMPERASVDLRSDATWNGTAQQDDRYPTSATFNGNISASTFTFHGDVEAAFAPSDEHGDVMPTSVAFSGHAESPSLFIQGDVAIEITLRPDLEERGLPSKLDFHGFIRGKDENHAEFEGSVNATVRNADTLNPNGPLSPDNFPQANTTFSGRVEVSGQAPVLLDISLDLTEWAKITNSIDYRRGTHTLSGTGVTEYSADPDSPFDYVFEKTTINLVSETGVKMELTYTRSARDTRGRIWKHDNDEDLATFEVEQGAVIVTYRDGTWDTVF